MPYFRCFFPIISWNSALRNRNTKGQDLLRLFTIGHAPVDVAKQALLCLCQLQNKFIG